MRRSRCACLAALVALGVSACVSPSQGSQQQPAPSAEANAAPRTLVAVERVEPKTLSSRNLLGQSFEGFGIPIRLFNAELAMMDDHDTPRPYLAEALPQLNTDTWRVFPDGQMETIWRLRPNGVWHDGAPFTAQDFVFGWQVYSKREFGTAGAPPYPAVQDVSATGDRTLVIRWRQPYPNADRLTGNNRNFPALPRHLLEASFQEQDPSGFASNPYFTRDYVGLGPYRIGQWEPGAYLEAIAFDQHILGRPKIARIEVRFIPDWDTAMANILAGQVHFVDSAISLAQAVQLQRDWVPQGAGSVAWDPNLFRAVFFQHRPELTAPPTLLDVRIRRALAYSIDKQSISENIYQGVYPVADFMIFPTSEYGARVSDAVQKYPYDPRRGEQLMNEAGFAKGSDGFFAGPSGHFEADVRSTAGFEIDMLAIDDGWRKLGFDVEAVVVPAAASLDPAQRVAFPGMYTASTPHGPDNLSNYTTSQIPRAENNWRGGQNRGGWSSPEYDRLGA